MVTSEEKMTIQMDEDPFSGLDLPTIGRPVQLLDREEDRRRGPPKRPDPALPAKKARKGAAATADGERKKSERADDAASADDAGAADDTGSADDEGSADAEGSADDVGSLPDPHLEAREVEETEDLGKRTDEHSDSTIRPQQSDDGSLVNPAESTGAVRADRVNCGRDAEGAPHEAELPHWMRSVNAVVITLATPPISALNLHPDLTAVLREYSPNTLPTCVTLPMCPICHTRLCFFQVLSSSRVHFLSKQLSCLSFSPGR